MIHNTVTGRDNAKVPPPYILAEATAGVTRI